MPAHFNNLNPAEAERLAILAEECAEVIQVIGKILRHGYESRHPNGGPTNRELMQTELGDLMCIMAMMRVTGDFDMGSSEAACIMKAQKIRMYLHHQDPSIFN